MIKRRVKEHNQNKENISNTTHKIKEYTYCLG